MQVRLGKRSPELYSVSQGALENENPRRMSQGLILEVELEILMDYIKEVMMSEGIWSAEKGVKCYLDDVLIAFTPTEKNWDAFHLF